MAGSRRLLERVLYELLLAPDSVAGREAGTHLADAVRGAATTVDLAASFTEAATLVLNRLAQTPADPGEKVVGIYLMRVSVSDGAVSLDVRIVTDAGGTAEGPLVVDVSTGG